MLLTAEKNFPTYMFFSYLLVRPTAEDRHDKAVTASRLDPAGPSQGIIVTRHSDLFCCAKSITAPD